jgi:8-oxo-dGTP diphosphatase
MDNHEDVPVQVVGAAIVDDLRLPTTLLTGRRTSPPALAGRWELPGGKIEPGERAAEALRREVLEELGVQIELGAQVEGPLGGAWRLGDRYLMRVWLARVTGGDPAPLEDHDQLRVLTKAQLYEVGWLSGDLPIVAALAALMS